MLFSTDTWKALQLEQLAGSTDIHILQTSSIHLQEHFFQYCFSSLSFCTSSLLTVLVFPFLSDNFTFTILLFHFHFYNSACLSLSFWQFHFHYQCNFIFTFFSFSLFQHWFYFHFCFSQLGWFPFLPISLFHYLSLIFTNLVFFITPQKKFIF